MANASSETGTGQEQPHDSNQTPNANPNSTAGSELSEYVSDSPSRNRSEETREEDLSNENEARRDFAQLNETESVASQEYILDLQPDTYAELRRLVAEQEAEEEKLRGPDKEGEQKRLDENEAHGDPAQLDELESAVSQEFILDPQLDTYAELRRLAAEQETEEEQLLRASQHEHEHERQHEQEHQHQHTPTPSQRVSSYEYVGLGCFTPGETPEDTSSSYSPSSAESGDQPEEQHDPEAESEGREYLRFLGEYFSQNPFPSVPDEGPTGSTHDEDLEQLLEQDGEDGQYDLPPGSMSITGRDFDRMVEQQQKRMKQERQDKQEQEDDQQQNVVKQEPSEQNEQENDAPDDVQPEQSGQESGDSSPQVIKREEASPTPQEIALSTIPQYTPGQTYNNPHLNENHPFDADTPTSKNTSQWSAFAPEEYPGIKHDPMFYAGDGADQDPEPEECLQRNRFFEREPAPEPETPADPKENPGKHRLTTYSLEDFSGSGFDFQPTPSTEPEFGSEQNDEHAGYQPIRKSEQGQDKEPQADQEQEGQSDSESRSLSEPKSVRTLSSWSESEFGSSDLSEAQSVLTPSSGSEYGPENEESDEEEEEYRQATPSSTRSTKRKDSSSPPSSPTPPSKKQNTGKTTSKQAPKKANPGNGKGKGKEQAPGRSRNIQKTGTVTTAATRSTGTKGTKRQAKPSQTQTQTKRKKAETLKLRAATRALSAAGEAGDPDEPTTGPKPRCSVYVFGANSRGQLGLGHSQPNVEQPTRITTLPKDTVGVVEVAAGGAHCVALTHDSRILTWGDNRDGQLGRVTRGDEDGSANDDPAPNEKEMTPTDVDFSHLNLPQDTVFVQVAATESATFVLSEFGDVYGWGTFRETYTSSDDQEETTLIGFRPSIIHQRTPLRIKELQNVKRLAAGSQHILAQAIVITLVNEARPTGKGKGKGRTSNKAANSTARVRKTKTTMISSVVYAWGANKREQLGRRILPRQRDSSTCLIPRRCVIPTRAKGSIGSVGAGGFHSFAVDLTGDIYAWGYNRHGQTGVVEGVDLLHCDSTIPVPAEMRLGYLEEDKSYSLTGGKEHSIAVTDDWRCLSWGLTKDNALGVRKGSMAQEDLVYEEGSSTPKVLKKPSNVSGISGRVTKAAAGPSHSILVTKNGTAYAWGSNGEFEVRAPRSDAVELPSAIDSPELKWLRVVGAAAGRQFSVLLVE